MCLSLSVIIPSHICRKMFEKVLRPATDANHLLEIHDQLSQRPCDSKCTKFECTNKHFSSQISLLFKNFQPT